MAFFQGRSEALAFTTLCGKMGAKGAMTSFSLEVLLAAILKSGARGINQNRLDYFKVTGNHVKVTGNHVMYDRSA